MKFIDEKLIKDLIKPRPEDSSKGDFGTLYMLCGSRYMTGAAALAAYGALRSGVGLLNFVGSEQMIKAIRPILFEPIYTNVEDLNFDRCDAFLCGCGIGREYDDELSSILNRCKAPEVLDADCINFLAKNKNLLSEICSRGNVTLTPHPGEMSRLTGLSIEEIQTDRINAAGRFASEQGCVLVLKGHNTVIASSDGRIRVNTTGSSALAKGGSGDVLAGVTASLNAQGYSPFDAATIAVYLHGAAGDALAGEYGRSGVIPSDLPRVIGKLLG